MSKLLRELLSDRDPRFTMGLTRLEQLSGSPGIDARLVGEVMTLAHAKTRALGLDPHDTTGAELFAALRAEALKSNDYIMAFFGHPASGEQLVQKVVSWAHEVIGDAPVWTLKDTALKTLYKKHPPKVVMKAFRFTSLDSMLKRMPVPEIALACRALESKTWWTKMYKHYESLQSKDFHKQKISIIALSDTKWQKVITTWQERKSVPVISAKECGVVGVGFSEGVCSGLLLAPLTIHTANEVIVHGAFMKLHHVHPSQGQVLVDMLLDGELISGSVSSSVFHWRDMIRYFGVHMFTGERTFAHLESSDLSWLRSEVVMASYIPALSFWAGTDFVGVSYGQERVVSLNLHDVALAVHHKIDYRSADRNYLKRALKSELMARYITEPTVRALVTKLFDISSLVDDNEGW